MSFRDLSAPVLSTLTTALTSPFGESTSGAIFEVLLLRNYNTRLVVLSTIILGVASGLVGSFLLLRKRSLIGDALSHACLPGIGILFILMVSAGGTGKYLPGLLAGATVTGVAGVALVIAIGKTTRIKDDAAMGIVLSVFFGLGVAILGMIQNMPGASAAGLESFIYGKTASMVKQDFVLITIVAGISILASLLLVKEFTLLAFDEGFAASLGWPVTILDMMMLALVAAVTVVGLQAVGLILIIAFLIIPAAAARFWTNDLKRMVVLASGIGGLSGWLGASFSAFLPRLPAGAVIVLTAAAIFVFSMIFGGARGVLVRALNQRRLRRKIGRQHLLRAVFEIIEAERANDDKDPVNIPVRLDRLLDHRSWSASRLRALIRAARKDDDVEFFSDQAVRLSEAGFGQAARTTRNHRLWELYLIRHADVAPAHVDRDADSVEHVLSADMVRQLEKELLGRHNRFNVPRSPHRLGEGDTVK